MYLSRIIKLIIMGFVLLAGTACTALNTKVGDALGLDSDLLVSFFVDADVNPDDNKISSPLIIRMYELKSPRLFKKANFIDIYEKDAEVLGADLVAKQRLKHIQPGENRKVSFVLSKETEYVGLFAEFLQYKNAEYKIIIPIAKTNVFSSSADIKLSGNQLMLVNNTNDETIHTEDSDESEDQF
ncbi:MAG: type VI secretion system lipoprotein TssJ [Gammaproteobacteria bacterium]|nr:type VI secretion system lipoprotein TssJ [Gammaproteobacteria bacterium]